MASEHLCLWIQFLTSMFVVRSAFEISESKNQWTSKLKAIMESSRRNLAKPQSQEPPRALKEKIRYCLLRESPFNDVFTCFEIIGAVDLGTKMLNR